MFMRKIYALLAIIVTIAITLACLAVFAPTTMHTVIPGFTKYEPGDTIDSFNEVPVMYNGSFNNTDGRHLTEDNYNLGLKWQCVEFVKRYYYNYYHHVMPDTYGHAKDFFNPQVGDGKLNEARGLLQYTNGSISKPQVGDILVEDKTTFNSYGHVAIITKVTDNSVEVIQQNVGLETRGEYKLSKTGDKWKIDSSHVLGWLRMK